MSSGSSPLPGTADAPLPDTVLPDTVDALLDTTWRLLADERSRREGLHSRAMGLTGFSGIILSLAGLAGIATGAEVGSPVNVLVAISYGLGLVFLVGGAAIAVLCVLMPRMYLSLSPEELADYPSTEVVQTEKVLVQGRTLRGLVDIFASERDGNNRMAAWMARAYGVLAAGLACIAVESFTLSLYYLF